MIFISYNFTSCILNSFSIKRNQLYIAKKNPYWEENINRISHMCVYFNIFYIYPEESFNTKKSSPNSNRGPAKWGDVKLYFRSRVDVLSRESTCFEKEIYPYENDVEYRLRANIRKSGLRAKTWKLITAKFKVPSVDKALLFALGECNLFPTTVT